MEMSRQPSENEPTPEEPADGSIDLLARGAERERAVGSFSTHDGEGIGPQMNQNPESLPFVLKIRPNEVQQGDALSGSEVPRVVPFRAHMCRANPDAIRAELEKLPQCGKRAMMELEMAAQSCVVGRPLPEDHPAMQRFLERLAFLRRLSSSDPVDPATNTEVEKAPVPHQGREALAAWALVSGKAVEEFLGLETRSPKPEVAAGRANLAVYEPRRSPEGKASVDTPEVSAPSVILGGEVATNGGNGGAERCDCGAKDSPDTTAHHCWWCGKEFP